MGTIEGIVTHSSNLQLEEIITEDGILCKILSLLSLKEAVRTSVLSSRWRYLWTRLTKFHFEVHALLDASLQYHDIAPSEALKLTKGDTTKFIPLVNSVLQQLQGARLQEFLVYYFLDIRHSQYLDEWVSFAVESGVKRLLFHLLPSMESRQRYGFPCHLLQSSTSIETLSLVNCSLKLPCKFDGLRHLRVLFLAGVYVNEEDFKCVVSSCCLSLTYLSLCKVDGLASISSLHPLNHLKKLGFRACHQLRKIDLNAKNLVKLVYHGVPTELKFRQSSKLIEADILFDTEGSMYSLDVYLTSLSSSLPHLQFLKFKLTNLSEVAELPKVSSKFIHLTHLNWDWDASVKMSLLHLSTLLDAAPLLQDFILILSTHIEEQPPQTTSDSTEMLPRHPHKHLKAIEIRDFYFETWQTEIAKYLLNNATKLEKMIVEKGSNPLRRASEKIHEQGTKSISQQVPEGVKLVITIKLGDEDTEES